MTGDSPSILIVTTQTWLQVTRLAARLIARGSRVSVICPEESPLAFMPEITGQFRFHVANPLRSLRQAIARCAADYVLPTDDFSVGLLHELARDPRLLPLIERSLGDSSSYSLVHSRFQLLTLARRLGITVPRTELIRHPEDMNRWVAEQQFPFVLKKDGTWGGQGVRLVRNAAELTHTVALLSRPESRNARIATWLRTGNGAAFARLRCLRAPELTAQAFIDGIPANSMYACREGEILGEVQARVVASRGKTGPSIVIQLMQDPRIHEAGVKLARELNISGFFGLDFMLDGATGEPYLIECNPRATQLGHLSVAGQADLASLLWAHWKGGQMPPSEEGALGPDIWIYPDGMRLLEETAGFAGCRPDAPPEKMAELERLIREAAPPRVRLRRNIRKLFSALRAAPQWEERPKPFRHPQLMADGTPPDPDDTGQARGMRITIAG